MKAGYQEAILLDDHGHVCEGTGENIYIVVGGEIVTPGHHNSILDGITRRSIMQLAADLGYKVIERNIARAELYLAEEVFMSGTAAELVPVVEVDDHKIGSGKPGEVTRLLAGRFRRCDPRPLRALPRMARRGRSAPGTLAPTARRIPPSGSPWGIPAPDEPDRTLRRHPARRHGGRRHEPHRAGEAASRARARLARRAHDRGRLPSLKPQGARAVRPACRRAACRLGDRRFRHDPSPSTPPSTATRDCVSWRTRSRPCARSSARARACRSRRSWAPPTRTTSR